MRMTMFIILTALLVVTGLADAAERELTPIPEGQIRLPVLPPGPQPEPPPQPTPDLRPVDPPSPREVTELKADHWFVIESDIPFFVLESQEGIVCLEYTEGPLKLKGKFADSLSGKNETRTYTSKYLATVEAVTKGQVALHCVPEGVKTAKACLRRTLTVMGEAPQPPPGPGPKPEPDPTPDPPKPTGKVHVAVVEDAMNRSPDSSIVLGALIGWHEWLDKGNTYRFYDQSTGESKGKKAIEDSGGLPVPYMVIYSESGVKLSAIPLPNTFAKLKEVLGGR